MTSPRRRAVGDWDDKELSFGEFKHRGPIVLKGDETNQIKEMLEESQLQIGSMLASRYVAPFREEVQGWMAKLTEVSENITLWQEVQATWMYLEVCLEGVGGERGVHEDPQSAVPLPWGLSRSTRNCVGVVALLCTEFSTTPHSCGAGHCVLWRKLYSRDAPEASGG